MKKSAKALSWVLLLCMTAFILTLPAPAQAAQDHDWTTYNLPAGIRPAAVVTIGSLVYVGTNDGLYKGIGDDWSKVDAGVPLGLVRGLAYDPVEQKMYVSDPDNTRVLVWNMADNTWGRFTYRNFDSRGLDLYRDGDQYRVYVTERTDNYVFEYRGASGYGNLSTDADPVGAMYRPYDAVRHGNTLYVADRENDRILVRSPGWSEIVHPTYTQDVTDLAVLSDGTLYFSEYEKDRVMKYADGHYTIVMAGSALLNGPWGVYADEWDNLFVCDRLNNRILRTQDDNDRLKAISVNTALLPGFSPDTYEYFLTYENRTESIDLDAWAESPYAVVSGTGTKELEVGENTFTIRVDPELGTHRDYVLHVTRLAPPHPAYTAELTADADTVEVGEDVTFTLTLTNTGDVGFTDMDAVNTVSTEHPIADLMLGVGETRTEEITVTAGDEDVEEGVRFAYDVVGRTAMGHEIHVSTGTCAVAVNGAAPESSDADEAEETAGAVSETPDAASSPVSSVSPEVSPSPGAEAEAIAAENTPGEPGGLSNTLLWAGGGLLLLLLIAVIILLIILLRQKKKGPATQIEAETAALPDRVVPVPPADAADQEEPVDTQIEDTKDTPED